jgi:hypothetical protein
MKRPVRFLIPVVFAVITTGCLDLETVIRFNRDLSGVVELRYSIDAALFDLGVHDPDNPIKPVPVAREDFQRLERLHSGLDLVSYSVSRSENNVLVKAEIGFGKPDDLKAVFGKDAKLEVVSEKDDTVTVVLSLEGSFETSGSEEPHDTLLSVLSLYHLRFIVVSSGTITEVSEGTIAGNGKRAEWGISLADAGSSQEPITWEITWNR